MKILKMKDCGEKHYTQKPLLFDLPFKLIVVGRSQLSGKTNLLGNLLLRKEYYRSDFKGENMYLISSSTSVDKKLQTIIEQKEIPASNVFPAYDEAMLETLYELLESDYVESVNNKQRPPNVLLIFDDISFGGQLASKKHGIMSKLFCNARHINVSTILTSQKYGGDILTTCRENTTGLIAFASTEKQLELITEDHNYMESKKQFKKMFRKATDEKHSFLVVNYSNSPKQRYLDSEFHPICTCADGSNKCGGKTYHGTTE